MKTTPLVLRRPVGPPPAALRVGLSASVVSLLAGAAVWEIVARLADFYFLPPISVVLLRLWELIVSGRIVGSLGDSLVNLALGFGAALVVGIATGLLMGAFRSVDAAIRVYANALLTAPTIVFAPIFFTFLGIGRATVVAVIFMYAVFFIIVTTADAIRTVPSALIDMGLSFNASRVQLFRRILIPSAMPLIMAGIRVSAARAVKGMINGELFIAAIGLGQVILRASHVLDIPTVLAVVILVVIVAILFGKLIQLVDAHVTRWVPETARASRLGIRPRG